MRDQDKLQHLLKNQILGMVALLAALVATVLLMNGANSRIAKLERTVRQPRTVAKPATVQATTDAFDEARKVYASGADVYLVHVEGDAQPTIVRIPREGARGE